MRESSIVGARVSGVRPAKPPMLDLMVDVDITNTAKTAQWIVLRRPRSAANGGVWGCENYELSGTGRVVVVRFFGGGAFDAFLLPPHAALSVVGYIVEVAAEPEQKRALIECLGTSDVMIGEQSIQRWCDSDPTSDGSARVSWETRRLLCQRDTPGLREILRRFVEPTQQRLDLTFSR